MGEWELENRDLRTRHPDDAQSKLDRWILSYGGSGAVSKALGVHQVTVCAWVGRRTVPNILTCSKILKLARGYLSLDDIIEGTRAH